jgi:hypothetical protein
MIPGDEGGAQKANSGDRGEPDLQERRLRTGRSWSELTMFEQARQWEKVTPGTFAELMRLVELEAKHKRRLQNVSITLKFVQLILLALGVMAFVSLGVFAVVNSKNAQWTVILAAVGAGGAVQVLTRLLIVYTSAYHTRSDSRIGTTRAPRSSQRDPSDG